MTNPSELDLAELTHEMRQMYKVLGFDGSLQVLFEIITSARVLSEIIVEEHKKGAK